MLLMPFDVLGSTCATLMEIVWFLRKEVRCLSVHELQRRILNALSNRQVKQHVNLLKLSVLISGGLHISNTV